jgi:hypothetical protein
MRKRRSEALASFGTLSRLVREAKKFDGPRLWGSNSNSSAETHWTIISDRQSDIDTMPLTWSAIRKQYWSAYAVSEFLVLHTPSFIGIILLYELAE